MAISNKTIQAMTLKALELANKTPGKFGIIEMDIRNGVLDKGWISVRVKKTGATFRTYWQHDGAHISKKQAVRVMRNHEQTIAALNPNPEAESHES